MHPITFTVSLPGQTQPLTVNLTDLLVCFQTVPDLRKRRGVRYPLAVLLTIAVLAKLSGQSQVHALADWASARAVELVAVFGLSRARMPIRRPGLASWAMASPPLPSKLPSTPC